MTEEDKKGRMGVALFTPIAPPKLTSISRAELVEWKKKRDDYEAQVETRCAGDKEKIAEVRVSVKNSMDRQLLQSCCEYEWDVAEGDLTDDKLNEHLDAIINKETDVKARVVKYFGRFDQLVSDYGIASLFQGDKGMKEKCKVLRDHLNPPGLKTAVEQALRFGTDDMKNKPKELYKVVKDKALEQDRLYQLRKKADRHPPVGKGTNQQHRGKSQHHGGRDKAGKVTSDGKKKGFRKVTVDTNLEQPGATMDGEAATKGKATVSCFKCGGPHYKNACPDLDEAEKEQELEKQKRKKAQKWGKAKRMMPDNAEGPMAWLNGAVKVPYCADSGSDWNLVSRHHVKQLQAVDPSVTVVKLDEPVKARAVGGATCHVC